MTRKLLLAAAAILLPAAAFAQGAVGPVQSGAIQIPSSAASIGIAPVVNATAGSAQVLKASAGNLYSVYATNLTSTAGFLVVVNLTSAPSAGTITPLDCVPLPASATASINKAPGPPAAYSTGIVALVSSAATCFTYTTGTITAFINGAVRSCW